MPLLELSRMAVGQSILGVLWGLWFAQLSVAAVKAESKTAVPTDLLRSAYVGFAIVAVVAVTVLFWLLQGSFERLRELETAEGETRARVLGQAISLVGQISLLWLLVSAVLTVLPFAAYGVFRGLSLHEAILSATAIPVWLGVVIVAALWSLAKQT